MNILLNWFPPAFNKIPSPAMSVLKGYLNPLGFDTDVMYWNIVMRDIISSAAGSQVNNEANEFEALVPFLAVILDSQVDKDKFERLCMFYQTKYPQYFSIDKETYYPDALSGYAKEILSRFHNLTRELYSKKTYSLIGICVKLLQLVPANIFAGISKSINPEIPILAGGISNKNEAIAALENFTNYDYAIWGEGENPVYQLCRYLNKEISINEVPNLAYRTGDEVRSTNLKNRIFSDMKFVSPDYSDYFNLCRENNIEDLHTLVPIESSRGCHWGKCKFCFLTEGYRNRAKENNKIVSEILNSIDNYSIYEFVFLDNDIIFNDYEKFDDLLNKLIAIKNQYEQFGIWNGEVVTKGLNSNIIKKMALAGFKSIQIGYEAISDSLLRKINKKNSFSSNLMFVKWATQYNLSLQGLNIITGLLEEDDSDICESIKNLHYLRFYLRGTITKHDVIPLQIMKSSRYYKQIKDDNNLHLWNDNYLFDLFPRSYIKPENKFDLMFFSSKSRNELWLNFERINEYYSKTNFKYRLYHLDENTIQYTEQINESDISKLEFDVNNAYHWNILKFCNDEVRSIDEMYSYFGAHSNIDKQEKIKNAINELNNEYILYSNPEYSENISIINTSFVY